MAALGSCWVVWRTWRDPDNWRLDAERRKIAFNNRKELALSMMVALGMIGLFFAWAS